MAGLYFEEFAVGQEFVHGIRRTVTETDNLLFTTMTHNPAALHLDAEYCKETEFGQILVNSLFTLSLVVGISVNDTTLGTTVANLGFGSVTFPKPVFIGDTLTVKTTVKALRSSKSRPGQGVVSFEHSATNQRGETVVVAERSALMLGRDSGS
jgi:acyl dehydratase